jgi:hypothetical protein
MLEDFGNSAAPENYQLLGLCLGAVSPSLAQITQDADVENQHDKFGVGGRHDHAGRRQTPLSAQ